MQLSTLVVLAIYVKFIKDCGHVYGHEIEYGLALTDEKYWIKFEWYNSNDYCM